MNNSFAQIKEKFDSSDSKRYWGDDFDVRFYLISNLKRLENKSILDIGGGIGIISSELQESNYKINLDLSFDDLNNCKQNYGRTIHNINSSMTDLPFTNKSFDVIICSHILEIAKEIDLKNNAVIKNSVWEYPTINKIFQEMHRILKNDGVLYLTTPNNAYYKSSKLTYTELKTALKNYFEKYSLYFYNTYPSFNKKYRKLNFTNIMPKIKLKFKDHSKIINELKKNDTGVEQQSVSFYVEIKN